MRVCGQVVHLLQTADGSRNCRKGSWTGYTSVAQWTDHTTAVSVCGRVIHLLQVRKLVFYAQSTTCYKQQMDQVTAVRVHGQIVHLWHSGQII